jgi:hypothetical protein
MVTAADAENRRPQTSRFGGAKSTKTANATAVYKSNSGMTVGAL